MPTLHFLNVGPGDCTWIQHGDGKNTVIDVCNARGTLTKERGYVEQLLEIAQPPQGISGNYRQKDYPVNPITYLQKFGQTSVFRFILTHPDMDHMDGLANFFQTFTPINFWDTNNNKQIDNFNESRYDKADWQFYQTLRGTASGTKRLALHSGDEGQFWNRSDVDTPGGSGLHILSPTPALVSAANENEDFNDCSYVLLWIVGNKRIVIGGDSHNASWEHILNTHQTSIQHVDLLLAPHHGRDSDRAYDFLNTLRPTLTLFGSAPSEHLGYSAWASRDLEIMTNNQGNCFVVDFPDGNNGHVYCSNENFARAYCRETYNKDTFYNTQLDAWFLKLI